MSSTAEAVDPIAACVRNGLSAAQKTLPPWLFYDAAGSSLFEQITELPEYYLTRTERALFQQHADEILKGLDQPISIVELGAGTATKTGILLRAATRLQHDVLYQPIDVSPSALHEAQRLEAQIAGLTVRAQTANYITENFSVERQAGRGILALYIGSSIGNFSPQESRAILASLREQLEPGDTLLLGADFAPGPAKTVATLLAAYDDTAGVTAAFNRNILVRLNRELGSNFVVNEFAHRVRWNAKESRIEMHLESAKTQSVEIPASSAGEALRIDFEAGETIHTENSYKFSTSSLETLLASAGFLLSRTFQDVDQLYAVSLGTAI